MKALTIWQPWASLIVHCLKPIEFRSWHFPDRMTGERVVIHAGAPAPRKAIQHLLLSDEHIQGSCGPSCDVAAVRTALERAAANPSLMTRSAGIGSARLGKPVRADTYYRRQGLAIGGEGPWNFAWPLLEVERWDEPVPCKGAQGFWNWPHA